MLTMNHTGRKTRKERKTLIKILAFFYMFNFNANHTSEITPYNRKTVMFWFDRFDFFNIPKWYEHKTSPEKFHICTMILGMSWEFPLIPITLTKNRLNTEDVRYILKKSGIIDGTVSSSKWYKICLREGDKLAFLMKYKPNNFCIMKSN